MVWTLGAKGAAAVIKLWGSNYILNTPHAAPKARLARKPAADDNAFIALVHSGYPMIWCSKKSGTRLASSYRRWLVPMRRMPFPSPGPAKPPATRGYVYGWFVRVDRGLYALSEPGRAALVRWKDHLLA